MSDSTFLDPAADADFDGEAVPAPLDGGVEAVLEELVEIVAGAKSVPLSASVMISRDEVLDLLEHARAALPDELRRAKHLLQDREEVFAAARREAGALLDDARVQAERMVQRTEIVRQAEYRGVRIVEDAEAEARRLRHEAEDYVDQKLAGFEIALERTMRTVRAGRERLAAVPVDPYRAKSASADGDQDGDEGDPFFDQDVE